MIEIVIAAVFVGGVGGFFAGAYWQAVSKRKWRLRCVVLECNLARVENREPIDIDDEQFPLIHEFAKYGAA